MCRESPSTRVPDGLDFSKSNAFKHDSELTKILAEALKDERGLFFIAPPTADEIMQRISSLIFKSMIGQVLNSRAIDTRDTAKIVSLACQRPGISRYFTAIGSFSNISQLVGFIE